MKILQVSNFFKPSFESGGVARVAYDISKYLMNDGYKVTVFTTNKCMENIYVKANKPLCLEGIKVYYFENLRKYFSINCPPIPYYSLFIVKKIIKDFDVVHIHEHRTMLAIIVSYYSRKYGVPYVLQPHGSILPIIQKQQSKQIFDVFFGNQILNGASKIIALNKIEAEQITKMGIDKSKIEIIPNGIDISEYSNLSKKGEFKKKYLIGDATKIILYLGRTDKIKGIDLLIDAFSSLLEDLDNIMLVIVGPISNNLPLLVKQVEDLNIDDKVVFTGPLYGKDKLEVYQDADIYVLPSRYETFPITVLEACACGTPVIITNKCGIADIVDGRLGDVVEFDKNELKNKLLEFFKSNKYIKYCHCDQVVKQEFNWLNVIRMFEKVYQEIISTQSE